MTAITIIVIPETEILGRVTTKERLLAYARLRDEGFTVAQAAALADGDYDVTGLAVIEDET